MRHTTTAESRNYRHARERKNMHDVCGIPGCRPRPPPACPPAILAPFALASPSLLRLSLVSSRGF